MDDGSQQPPAYGSGQQRGPHPRPFFYVQPPSQPYYLYQHWQLSNPYHQYGVPAAFNFNRPYMHPYQYMQYPGFVYPQAPMYPVDYRRMYEPRYNAPPWSQQHHPQPQGRREMACSEAQTDPSDAITKLIECLDKIRANELRQGAERELDSGVASQSSGMFSPREEKKSDEHGPALPSMPGNPESPAVVFSDSTMAVYDGESSHRSLDTLSPEGCWSGGLEEELPLDSSSVHEQGPEPLQTAGDEGFVSHETEVADVQSDILATHPSIPKGDARESKPTQPAPSSSTCQPPTKEAKGTEDTSKTEHQILSFEKAESDPSFQILKLPFESILTPDAVRGGRLSSPVSPYFYNYLALQGTHERMSVLSPSLDELSSRDEMFSTDLDDVELFPKTVYPTARTRLAEVVAASPQAGDEVEDACLPRSKRSMCICCGKNLAKGASRSKVQSSAAYRNEAGDSDEEARYGRGREQPVQVVVRKHPSPKKPHAVPPRHAAKPWYKRGQYKDPSDPFEQEEVHDLCKKESADGRVAEMTGGDLHCRTCQDGLCREDLTTSDQARWAEGDAIPRRRQQVPLQRQEMSNQRKVIYHRPRDEDDDEPPPLHWDRGSTMREPRC